MWVLYNFVKLGNLLTNSIVTLKLFVFAAISGDGQRCKEVYSAAVWSTGTGILCAPSGAEPPSLPLVLLLQPREHPGSLHLSPRLPLQARSDATAVETAEKSFTGEPSSPYPPSLPPSLPQPLTYSLTCTYNHSLLYTHISPLAQSELGYGKIQTYSKLEKLGEVREGIGSLVPWG